MSRAKLGAGLLPLEVDEDEVSGGGGAMAACDVDWPSQETPQSFVCGCGCNLLSAELGLSQSRQSIGPGGRLSQGLVSSVRS
ncbi:hypothetical protein Micbo1qcDRAFT_155581 [Microdochium bolleyi]|uniref:Uncharacterized protein n=1 Tax=Microdochium bolleyi TaxID=196109 RepID=A0A136JIB4_9PEZI|nr:hypothetical protein Micbo1qcDRAFT_155581 [Microdochium bolleyi]